MRTIFAVLVFIAAINAYAGSPDINCLRKEYLTFTNKTDRYWTIKDAEFKKHYPELYKDFSYLIKEQIDHNRMQEITMDYLVKVYPEALKLDGSLYNMVPRYKHYEEKIYRELRDIAEFNQLYLEIESYKKENRMPEYNGLKRASEIIWTELDKLPVVREAKDSAIKQAEKMVSTIPCNS